jgi:S-adenosylmethionine hydrolase
VSVLTLTTDFGTGSPYVAAMKGVILSIHPRATIVDITHDIRPQDISHGAIVLEDVCDRFPPDTTHVVVVDPGVGTDRAIVYARIGCQKYVAPDNGLLSRLAKRTPPSQIIHIQEPKYWLQPVSATFHGRDIMAPVAAHLSLGVDPTLLGPPADKLLEITWPEVRVSPNRLEGTVLEIDSFGNVITNITADLIAGRPTDERACVVCDLYETWGIYGTYAEHPSGTLIALVGSSGRLELALVGGNAARRLGIKIGTPVTLAWE